MKHKSHHEAKVVAQAAPQSSENEESDCTATESSSMSERLHKKRRKSTTQFSVLRSDTDGLRMKISAIRRKTTDLRQEDVKSRSENNNIEPSKSNRDKMLAPLESATKPTVSALKSCCSIYVKESDSRSEASSSGKIKKLKLKRKKTGKHHDAKQLPFGVITQNPQTLFKNTNHIKDRPLSSLNQPSVLPDDNIGLSSSDNELPALVSAAIKCVESDSDSHSNCTQPKIQYTSSLLQDFMEKTQKLSESANKGKRTNEIATTSTASTSLLNGGEQTQLLRKKRGRPKKSANAPVVNESADSGVVSSHAQSISPSPKNLIERSRSHARVERNISPPKIDIVNLEKRVYAMNERVLYPPPKSKMRKQQAAAPKQAPVSVNNKSLAIKSNHKEDTLDPVWRKIDVNSKFRRPSVSGYKSDGCGFSTTVCSKILTAKSGYASDYSVRNNHYSGYKSDASGKSRCSMKSCYSRVSRAKSCDGKRRTKFRRKRRPTLSQSKSVININEQDILQLAGLSLGQSSEESSGSVVCKPKILVEDAESTNVYKKYGEINRYITTGEYFGRSKTSHFAGSKHLETCNVDQESQDPYNFLGSIGTKLCSRSRKSSVAIELPPQLSSSRKLKSRRSSVASFCSSFFSGVSKVKRRHRRKSNKFGCSKMVVVDSKLLTEIEIITNSFPIMCRIHCDKPVASGYAKEKAGSERIAPQKSLYQNKRNLKKRKLSENVEFALSNGITLAAGATSKRRHKKTCSSSPDDHKLPLKKRHYLLTPGDKTEKASVAYAAEALKSHKEATDLKANIHVAKPSGRAVSTRAAVTPKKRHLLQTCGSDGRSNSPNYVSDSKSYSSKNGATDSAPAEVVNNKKRNRLEGLVSKIASASNLSEGPSSLGNEASFPPPGIFEPSVELEIQIPITKLGENSIITKAEAESPLDLLDLHNKTFPEASSNGKAERVVESLLNKTGCNFMLKRKRKKINRTGFPTVKRKKRKVSELSAALESESKTATEPNKADPICDRVPQAGETSATFLERNRTPRLSVVSLERLQGTNKKQIARELTPSRTRSAKTSTTMSAVKNRKQSKLPKKDQPRPLSKKKDQSVEPLKTSVNPLLKMTFPTCKIRLKRRITIPQAAKKPAALPAIDQIKKNEKEITSDKDQPEKAPKATMKKPGSEATNLLEQEPLPLAAFCDATNAIDSESSSSVSVLSEDSKSTSRKQKWKKSYLVAGLLSDYYKVVDPARGKKPNLNQVKEANFESVLPVSLPLLPAPPYCEKFFRRTETDFQLPYDIWWSYTNGKLPTRETVPSWNYRKIRTNVYRCAEVRPNTNNIDRPTCNCKPDVGCSDDCLNRMVYTECSPSSCPTKEKCKNQKIQRHEVAPGVERFMTENKGWGVRTKLPIKKGTYILEYVGEVVTEKEFKDRMATLYINDTHHYCLHLDGGLVIDGHRMGSDGRFVNHSCSPNCEMQKWSVNGLSRMALFAARNIEAGEEISYDYNFSLFNPSEGQECRCNTPQCRGVIGGKSQRIKPLVEPPKPVETSAGQTDGRRSGRPRKRQGSARKDVIRLQSKDIVMTQMLQPLSEKDKRLIGLQRIFLIRNFEKVRRIKSKGSQLEVNKVEQVASAALQRRPSTPSSIAVQISALRSPRSIQTRCLAQAVQDPEVEKMAKMAVIFRDICSALEEIKDENGKPEITKLYPTMMRKKGKQLKQQVNMHKPVDLITIQANVEKGYYKVPMEFDEDVESLLSTMREFHKENPEKLSIIKNISELYFKTKDNVYDQLVELAPDKNSLKRFRPNAGVEKPPMGVVSKNFSSKSKHTKATTEDIISCICGLYKDEGLMIQCARCNVWQHTECTKADVNADSYLCERCDSRVVDREIPLDDFTEDGHRYYLSLMRGDLQIRQGDTVYVLRDIPMKDENGVVCASKKHTYKTIGEIDYSECDIFRVERLWKDANGKRVIFGHHFLRPHETFHEPSRRFYPNEVVRVPLYELVPIDLVIGRCWVLDRTTFCKGRPVDCNNEDHVFICELRVDKSARFFAKAKINWPTCTKSYAFKKFDEKLRICKTYAPHDVDPALLKPRRQKTDAAENTTAVTPKSTPTHVQPNRKTNVVSVSQKRKEYLPVKTRKQKRNHLEVVLAIIKKLKSKKNTHMNEGVLDVSYLLSGRGARNRKSIAANVPT
ncbi:histone-lysine N-methyltransferase ash1 [Eupeodes corollae]|uniref:histone-lysine N-methyltransferase ash1 n=1 Tax=Eupeodes corollae TaxID=290404 RepID=UPI00248FC652|nr:histone-lysine N-methyltransferase ash1 [Eupeodes corollae]XP_055908018.1 histone-lysine N-methyltransferase ash1 [Eupeodes corollae]